MMRQRFQTLLSQLTRGLYEKDVEIGMSLLAAMAGESVLLLGPPGVAKSMVARRIKLAFSGARSFEYLMSRFSTPDEIFGPVSISRLKSEDIYERNIDGFMPTADVVFLDEIWKAGPAILNTLLTIINEKTYRNGREELRVPLKLLMGASNELPADGEGLEALWDRFLVRMVSGCVSREDNFYRILLEESEGAEEPAMDEIPSISAEEYADWQKKISAVGIDSEVLETVTFIRRNLCSLRIADNDESAARVHNVYVSDRRWKHIMHLLRASAFLHGRQSVGVADMMPLVHCLWNEPDEIPAIRSLVARAAFQTLSARVQKTQVAVSAELKRTLAQRAMARSMHEGYVRDDNKKLYDGYYYLIDNYMKGSTFIFFVDYRNLRELRSGSVPTEAVIQPDPRNPKKDVLRMSDSIPPNAGGVRVKLYRDADNIYINGVKYPIHLLARGEQQSGVVMPATAGAETDYESIVEELSFEVRKKAMQLMEDNLLVADDDKAEIDNLVKVINHEIAQLRFEVQKLLYDED